MRRNDDFHELDRDLKQLAIQWDEKRKRIGHDKLMQKVSNMKDKRNPWKRFMRFTVNVAALLLLCVVGYNLVIQPSINPQSSLKQPPTESNTAHNDTENMYDADETEAEHEEATVTSLIEAFGQKLQHVSLLAPDDVVRESIEEHYGDFVSPALLEKWLDDPSTAPGRLVSSPSPERIEILGMEKVADDQYDVEGEVIEVTSVESDGAANKYPITLQVKHIEDQWLIDDVIVEDVIGDGILYEDTTYGFTFALPESWRGYEVINEQWEGNDSNGNTITGSAIVIRHPEWTEAEPRQDITIMIMTHAQWNAVQAAELRIGSAPIPPKELGQNQQYVFALPARYNYGFPTGYEEVEEILENDPLRLINVE